MEPTETDARSVQAQLGKKGTPDEQCAINKNP